MNIFKMLILTRFITSATFKNVIALLCFSWSPVMFLLSHNYESVRTEELVVVLFLVASGTILCYFLLSYFAKSDDNAFLSTVVVLTTFFSFGHVFAHGQWLYRMAQGLYIGSFCFGRYRYLLSIWGTIGTLIVIFSLKRAIASSFVRILRVFCITIFFVVFVSVIQRARILYKSKLIFDDSLEYETKLQKLEYMPNIYCFIFDQYGRQDILKVMHGYDNSWFTNILQKKGFFVANKSCSNYGVTSMSIPSSFFEKAGIYIYSYRK